MTPDGECGEPAYVISERAVESKLNTSFPFFGSWFWIGEKVLWNDSSLLSCPYSIYIYKTFNERRNIIKNRYNYIREDKASL